MYLAALFVGRNTPFWREKIIKTEDKNSDKKLLSTIKEDFESRKKLNKNQIYFFCNRTRYKWSTRLLNKAKDRIDNELDILNIVRAIRGFNVKFNILMKPEQAKLAEKLSMVVLSDLDYESSSSEDSKYPIS